MRRPDSDADRLPVLLLITPAMAKYIAGSMQIARRMLANDRALPVPGASEIEAALRSVAALSGQEQPSFAEPLPTPDDAAMTNDLLTYTGAAKATSLSERTLRRAVANGDLTAVRVGRTVRFHPDDLDSFIRSRRGDA